MTFEQCIPLRHVARAVSADIAFFRLPTPHADTPLNTVHRHLARAIGLILNIVYLGECARGVPSRMGATAGYIRKVGANPGGVA